MQHGGICEAFVLGSGTLQVKRACCIIYLLFILFIMRLKLYRIRRMLEVKLVTITK